MLWLYRLLFMLAAPLLARRLQRSAAAGSELALRAGERRGEVAPAGHNPIWLHAASVGEVNAARALVQALRELEPERALIVSTFTLSGARHAQALFGDRVAHRLAPLDTSTACARWLDTLQPGLALVVETEIWPELFHQTARRAIPLVLVNARLSERGFGRSRLLGRLFRGALAEVSLALCQSQADLERLVRLGLARERAYVSGNLKFDAPLADGLAEAARRWREHWAGRSVWVAGSSRPGEEPMLLEAQRRLLERHPQALLILAPRHPERQAEVLRLIDASGLSWVGLDELLSESTSVVLVDRIGVLQACYAAASVAFVGGSLVKLGGHNLLEPAACAKPVLAGPWLDQQQASREALEQAGGLTIVTDAEALAEAIDRLWTDPEQALVQGRAALGVVERGRGSLRSTLRHLEPWLRTDA